MLEYFLFTLGGVAFGALATWSHMDVRRIDAWLDGWDTAWKASEDLRKTAVRRWQELTEERLRAIQCGEEPKP